MDEVLQKYLKEKYAEQLGDINTGQMFANLGDVIAGQKVGTTSPYFTEQRKLAESQTLGEIEKQRELEMKKAQLAETLNTKLLQMAQQKQLTEQGQEIQKMGLKNAADQRAADREWKMLMAQDKAAERAAKKEDLGATQAKQLGVAEMGQRAASQYQAALEKGKKAEGWEKYDPTSYGDWLQSQSWTPGFLKSDAAKEANAAKESWVETYLRDASGAAIPQDERLDYARPFFEAPGDTPQVIANKAELRAQKERNALLGAGPGAKRFEKVETPQVPNLRPSERSVTKKLYSPSQNKTRVIYSDGTEEVLSGKQ